MNFIVTGGLEMGDDLGYGPARGLTSGEVGQLAAALKAIPPDSLLRRFDPAALTSAAIYPEIWELVDGAFRVGHTGQDAVAGLDGYLAGRLGL